MAPTSVIIGSSSGIGRALADIYREHNLPVLTFSRYPERLEGGIAIELDLTHGDHVERVIEESLSEQEAVDVVYLVSGNGEIEADFDSATALDTLALNCEGFTRAAYAVCRHFESRGSGHLVGITSVAAIRGGSQSLSYNASKAYQTTLLEGIRCRFFKSGLPVYITEVRPGFVDTAMMKAEKPFWVSTPRKAAMQIMKAVKKRVDVVYVTRRWCLIAGLLSLIPSFLYKRIG